MQMNNNDLKQAREKKNLTLEQIAQRTKISLSYLEAIEQNDFDQLPVHLAPSYIRKYAKLLNVEPTLILESYQSHMAKNDNESDQKEPIAVKAESRRRSPAQKPAFWKHKMLWISVGSFVVLGGLGWFMIHLFTGEDDPEATEQITVEATKQPEDQKNTFQLPTVDERAILKLVEPIEVNNKEDRYQISNAQNVEIEVTALAPTQITVNPESGETKTISLKIDEKQTFTDVKAISIELMTPSQVTLLANGNRVDTKQQSEKALYHFSLLNASSQ